MTRPWLLLDPSQRPKLAVWGSKPRELTLQSETGSHMKVLEEEGWTLRPGLELIKPEVKHNMNGHQQLVAATRRPTPSSLKGLAFDLFTAPGSIPGALCISLKAHRFQGHHGHFAFRIGRPFPAPGERDLYVEARQVHHDLWTLSLRELSLLDDDTTLMSATCEAAELPAVLREIMTVAYP